MNKNSNNSNDKEINFLQLFQIIWQKKLFIFLSTLIFTLLSGSYILIAKEKWTSKSEVIAPIPLDLDNYLNVRKEYVRILGDQFDSQGFLDTLFAKFERLTYSNDERRTFFKNTLLYKELSEGKTEQEKEELLNQLVIESIKTEKPNLKKDSQTIGLTISLTAHTPELAQNTLSDFISYINQQAFELDVGNFSIFFKEKIEDLKFEQSQIEKELNIQKSVQLQNLNKAFNIAEKAGIKEYSKTFSDNSEILTQALGDAKIPLSDSKLSDSSYLFMLGEKYLQAQIQVNNDYSLVYPPKYYDIKEKLALLEPLLNKVKDIKAKTYHYQASPSYPTKKDWPLNILILSFGMLFGLIASSTLIVILYIIRKK